MTRYEFAIREVGPFPEKELQQISEEGWQIVFVERDSFNTFAYSIWLQRPVDTEAVTDNKDSEAAQKARVTWTIR